MPTRGGGITWKSGKSPEQFASSIQAFKSRFVDLLAVEMEVVKAAGVKLAKIYAPVDTGELRDSIEGAVDRMAQVVVISLTATAGHASHQEYGTVSQSGKPYLRPALQAMAPMVIKRVSSAWDRAWASV